MRLLIVLLLVISGLYLIANIGQDYNIYLGPKNLEECCSNNTPISITKPWSQTIGNQRTAIILGKLSGQTTLNKTSEQVYDDILNASNFYSFNNFLQESSYNNLWLTGNVYGWFEIDTGDPQNFVNAADPFIDFTKIDRLILVNPVPNSSYSLGAGSATPQPFYTQEGIRNLVLTRIGFYTNDPWLFGSSDLSRRVAIEYGQDYNLLSHEFGHSLKLSHPGIVHCPNNQIISINMQNCLLLETENVDQVGIGTGHYNSFFKESMGWFKPSNIKEISETGEYTLKPLEVKTNDIQVLKVPRVTCPVTQNYSDPCGGDGKGWYYIEFRRNIGHDKGLFKNTALEFNGVEIRIDGYSNYPTAQIESQLLDMEPPFWNSNHTLQPGKTFVEPFNNLSITTLEISDQYAKVRVVFP